MRAWSQIRKPCLEINRIQEELAELAEIDRPYVQRIERGTANPGIEIVGRLREVFEVSWSDLLG